MHGKFKSEDDRKATAKAEAHQTALHAYNHGEFKIPHARWQWMLTHIPENIMKSLPVIPDQNRPPLKLDSEGCAKTTALSLLGWSI